MRKPFVGGNWKMHTNAASARTLADSIAETVGREGLDRGCDVAIFPPLVYLRHVNMILRTRSSPVMLGAQDVYFQPDGAFTGEVSTDMLKDCGVSVVLAGHSERRHIIGEPDELVNRKARAILDAGLWCILCVGETLEQRTAGQTDQVNTRQLAAGLNGVHPDQMPQLTIAYEPVWAIGTGKVATPADAQAAQSAIRDTLADLYTPAIADSVRIQYGGSANPSNVTDILSQPDVDGGLVGGASLKADNFCTVVRIAAACKNFAP